MADPTRQDKTIPCVDCGKPFVFTIKDQDFFKQQGFYEPRRCKPCREARKKLKESQGS